MRPRSHDEALRAVPTPSQDTLPSSWPSNILYTTSPIYTSTLTPSQIRTLNKPTPTTSTWPKLALSSSSPSPSQIVHIQPITTPTHPAYLQNGLFATRHLAPNEFIIPYLGLVHANAAEETDESSDYDLSLDRELGFSIDAAAVGNESRFMNDYRGVRSEGPNAEFRDCWVQIEERSDGGGGGKARGRWERRMGVFVLGAGKAGKRKEGIARGEEVVVNYGRSFWRERMGAGAEGEEEEGGREKMGDEAE